MAYRRTFRRRYARRNKYNINSYIWNQIPAAAWTAIQQGSTIYYSTLDVVPNSSVGGTRKVKRFQINMALPANIGQTFFWALVYVPEGTAVTKPTVSGEGYQPTQYVLAQGLLAPQVPVRYNTPIARNINQNDSVKLIVWSDFGQAATDVNMTGYVQHAICYN